MKQAKQGMNVSARPPVDMQSECNKIPVPAPCPTDLNRRK